MGSSQSAGACDRNNIYIHRGGGVISDVLDRLLRAYRHMLIEKAVSMGLTELQLSALLAAAEGVNTVVKLADRLMVAQPTATDTLLALEKKGFITRHRVGKTTVIKLTEKGVKPSRR